MALFWYNVNDTHDRIQDIVAAANNSGKADVIRAHQFAADVRQAKWDNRRLTSNGSFVGNPEFQWLAHIPRRVADLLDLRHPGWDSNEDLMMEVLKHYPECRITSQEELGA